MDYREVLYVEVHMEQSVPQWFVYFKDSRKLQDQKIELNLKLEFYNKSSLINLKYILASLDLSKMKCEAQTISKILT